ncbi:hypothetical protein ACN4EK_14350 [Pantanalinema rosaneae CENA516]|uniref:hypothetical protein n=1 Tax=Pantanalinema rosaneae TaxID=1620701 RepID=UPI003D6E0CB2
MNRKLISLLAALVLGVTLVISLVTHRVDTSNDTNLYQQTNTIASVNNFDSIVVTTEQAKNVAIEIGKCYRVEKFRNEIQPLSFYKNSELLGAPTGTLRVATVKVVSQEVVSFEGGQRKIAVQIQTSSNKGWVNRARLSQKPVTCS